MRVPLAAVPAARPRVTSKGVFYPSRYAEWQKSAADMIAVLRKGERHGGPVKVEIVLWPDSFDVTVGVGAGRWGRADIDNVAKAILDAAVAGGLLADDRLVSELHVRFGSV